MLLTQRLFSAALLAAAAFASHAGATEVQTPSYSAWLGTVSGSPAEWDFNIPDSSYGTAAGYNMKVGSFGPINVTGPDGGGYVLNKNPGYGTSNYLALEGAGDGVGTMYFTTPAAGLTGFGLGLGETGSQAPITLTLSDGETFTFNPTVGGTVFAGFSSATSITSILLRTTSGTKVELTDFLAAITNQSGTAPSSPAVEGATVIMIGGGLFLLGAGRKVFSNNPRSRSRRHSRESAAPNRSAC